MLSAEPGGHGAKRSEWRSTQSSALSPQHSALSPQSSAPSPQSSGSSRAIVRVDPRYFRPTEVETLLGDASKAKNKLGWTPKITFDELVSEMVREDLKDAEKDELVKKHGYHTLNHHE